MRELHFDEMRKDGRGVKSRSLSRKEGKEMQEIGNSVAGVVKKDGCRGKPIEV